MQRSRRRTAAGRQRRYKGLFFAGVGYVAASVLLANCAVANEGQRPATGGEWTALAELEPWVGVWVSRLDPKYRDHPMVRRFNPDLKSQELHLRWGIEKQTLHLQVWQLDRPPDGDRTLVSEGLALPHPADGSIVLAEYGAAQKILHSGTYDIRDGGDLHRTYEAFFADGSSRHFREIWRWTNRGRTAFEWITQHREDDDWISGDVVVDWARQQP